MTTQLQYIRRCNLVVSGASGDGLDLSSLRIVFKIKKSDAQTPNTAEIRVYNLAPDTAKQIRKEFKRVVLQVGYESNYGVIFDGNIKQVRMGRENGTDTTSTSQQETATTPTTMPLSTRHWQLAPNSPTRSMQLQARWRAEASTRVTSRKPALLLFHAERLCTETHVTTFANRLRLLARLGLFKMESCNWCR